MRLTKLEHAALVLDDSGDRLFIDPGSFTTPLTDTAGAVGVLVTHEHADHWTPEQLARILDANPELPIFAPAGVAAAASGFEITVVSPGDVVQAGPFSLRFFGGEHAVIHSSLPVVDNLGVLVNDLLYYPGDSFLLPDGLEIDTLAVPSSGPWLKLGDAMDFVLAVRPHRAFPTHEMVNSVLGKRMTNTRLAWATEQGGGEYFALEPGDTLEF